MKAKTIYECEFCHATFTDEEKCKKCENSHTKMDDLLSNLTPTSDIEVFVN